MSKLALSLTAALFMTGGANAQSRIANGQEAGFNGCGFTQRAEALPRSVEGIDLRVMTPGPDGGVLVGGSVFRDDRKGLILRVNGGVVEAILIPRLQSFQGLFYTTKETGLRLYTGTLYATNDGGICWRKSSSFEGVTDMYFIDRQNGWLYGLGGVIYRTSDAGKTWHRQNSGTELDIRKVSFIDPLHGWARTSMALDGFPLRHKSSLIRTQDGGRNWETLLTEETIELVTFSFVSSYEGWGVEWGGNIVHTVDGGRTWDVQHKGGQRTWRDIHFINSKEGWVVGDGIMRTADGGATWKMQLQSDEPTHPSLEAVYFSDNRTGWAMSTRELLHTSDAGLTWKTIFKHAAYRDFGLTSAQKQ